MINFELNDDEDDDEDEDEDDDDEYELNEDEFGLDNLREVEKFLNKSSKKYNDDAKGANSEVSQLEITPSLSSTST